MLVYLGFNAALSRWPSTRVYAWTFLVPVVAVAVGAIRGALPGIPATIGRLPMNGKRMVSRAPPASARRVAIMIGEVWFSAESVTG